MKYMMHNMFIELIIICTPSRHLDLVFEFGFSVCDESLQFGPLTAHSAGRSGQSLYSDED